MLSVNCFYLSVLVYYFHCDIDLFTINVIFPTSDNAIRPISIPEQ